ncbi:MAG: carbohydrate ABC transporter permease [Bifidobacteriaceae bacterium]|jgi:ABC-type glycerol-3-phosphate transport system permease component|nr:carbohydrate ABC transporter permease [Bifidobacteriaceae bacterium]
MFSIRTRTGRLLLTLLVAVMVIPFVVPLITMVQVSLSGIGWGNYKAVISLPSFWTYFRNSAVIAAGTIVIVYFLTMAASFGFSKLRIRSKEVYFWALMAALTMPEVVLLAPLVIMASKVHAGGAIWAVILPIAALQIPFTTLLTRSYVDGIPDELLEAARIDGASTWRQFWHVVIPLAKPMAVAICILVLINAWNSYLLPMVLLGNTEGHMVVTQLPNSFKTRYTDDQTKILAGAVLAALPEIIAYISLQRHFERGMAAGALK